MVLSHGLFLNLAFLLFLLSQQGVTFIRETVLQQSIWCGSKKEKEGHLEYARLILHICSIRLVSWRDFSEFIFDDRKCWLCKIAQIMQNVRILRHFNKVHKIKQCKSHVTVKLCRNPQNLKQPSNKHFL